MKPSLNINMVLVCLSVVELLEDVEVEKLIRLTR